MSAPKLALVVGCMLGLAGQISAEETDARAALRALGPQHIEPLLFPATKSRAETWLGLIGDKDGARAAYVARVERGHARTLHVQHWPPGVRVLGSQLVGDSAVFVVQPTARTDGKAREPAVVSVLIAYSEAPLTDPPGALHVDLAGVRDAAELGKRLGERHRKSEANQPPDASRAAAARTPESLVAAISRRGLDVYRIRQSAWLERVDHLAPGAAASERWLARTRAILREPDMSCVAGVCSSHETGPLGTTSPQVIWEEEDGRWVIRALVELPEPAAPVASTGTRRAVSERSDGARTARALKESLGLVGARLLGEAPLDARGGIVGVGVANNRPYLVATTEGIDRAFSLEEDPWANPTAAPKLDARFGDLDGDGRTDVVLWTDSGESLPFAAVLRAPASSLEAPGFARDLGSELALMGAKDAADALARALASPHEGPTREEACALFGGKAGRTAFQRAAAKTVRVLRFSGYVPFTWRPEAVASGRAITNADLSSFGQRCRRLVCLADGPLCAHAIDDPLDDAGRPLKLWSPAWYWFTREAGKWKVAGYAAMVNGMTEPASR